MASTWRKSSYSSATGSCVEIAPGTRTMFVRDSKNPAAGTLSVSRAAFADFLRDARVR
jgi:hypothetical protein